MKKKKIYSRNIKGFTSYHFLPKRKDSSPKTLPKVLPYEITYRPLSFPKKKIKKPRKPKKKMRKISLGNDSEISDNNIINIVNNMNSGKSKKIDLKMNINRYNIKYYVSDGNSKLDNMLKSIQHTQNYSEQDVNDLNNTNSNSHNRLFSANQIRGSIFVDLKRKKDNKNQTLDWKRLDKANSLNTLVQPSSSLFDNSIINRSQKTQTQFRKSPLTFRNKTERSLTNKENLKKKIIVSLKKDKNIILDKEGNIGKKHKKKELILPSEELSLPKDKNSMLLKKKSSDEINFVNTEFILNKPTSLKLTKKPSIKLTIPTIIPEPIKSGKTRNLVLDRPSSSLKNKKTEKNETINQTSEGNSINSITTLNVNPSSNVNTNSDLFNSKNDFFFAKKSQTNFVSAEEPIDYPSIISSEPSNFKIKTHYKRGSFLLSNELSHSQQNVNLINKFGNTRLKIDDQNPVTLKRHFSTKKHFTHFQTKTNISSRLSYLKQNRKSSIDSIPEKPIPETSVSQIEAEMLLDDVFNTIFNADLKDQKLNRSVSFEEIDFKSSGYKKNKKKVISFVEKGIHKQLNNIMTKRKNLYIDFLTKAKAQIKQNTVYKSLLGKFKQNFNIFINPQDKEKELDDLNVNIMEKAFQTKLIYYELERDILLLGKVKIYFLEKYFEISGEITSNFLTNNDYQIGRKRYNKELTKAVQKPQRKKMYLSKEMLKSQTMAKAKGLEKTFVKMLSTTNVIKMERLIEKASLKKENSIFVQDFVSKDTSYLLFNNLKQVDIPIQFECKPNQLNGKMRSISFLENVDHGKGIGKTRSFDKILRIDSQSLLSPKKVKHKEEYNSFEQKKKNNNFTIKLTSKITFQNDNENSEKQESKNNSELHPALSNGCKIESPKKSRKNNIKVWNNPAKESNCSVVPQNREDKLKLNMNNLNLSREFKISKMKNKKINKKNEEIPFKKAFFSSKNKDITLIETNKIKNNYFQTLGDDIYQHIFYFIEEHNVPYIQKLINDNKLFMNINQQDEAGNTFLIRATISNFEEILEFLLQKGCDPNICNVRLKIFLFLV